MKNELRVLRAQRGWSQAELGDRIGVSRQAINAVETGKFDPSLPLAMRLAKLFGRRVEEIFTLDESER
ncbi:MAG: transcriptional regulator [Candidatus Eremiobacter antarcticus]|nr:helix-turn-helix transcriptional regulator [Candidatus Eremiobacteraeota bacterium]PZR62452.1 MAG: transcriptional regulator [Candidatus Eremiobacter sp. RRmetagenome_bin22]